MDGGGMGKDGKGDPEWVGILLTLLAQKIVVAMEPIWSQTTPCTNETDQFKIMLDEIKALYIQLIEVYSASQHNLK